MQPAQSSPSTRQVRAWHFCLLATECSLYSQTSLIAAASPYLPFTMAAAEALQREAQFIERGLVVQERITGVCGLCTSTSPM